jgi:alkaline phosphatase
MSTGIKTYSSAIGVSPEYAGEDALEHASALLRRIFDMAVGFVTTVEYYHATPAGFFAHNASRNAYSAIAHELTTSVMPDVMIGAGYGLGVTAPSDLRQLETSGKYVAVQRQAGVDGSSSLLVGAARAVQENKRLFGLFGNTSDSTFTAPVPRDNPGSPSIARGAIEDPTLTAATTAALNVLSQDPDGFFLLVEQGTIDKANHSHNFSRMIGCVAELDDAVKAVVKFVDEPGDAIDWSNTTLIVTADHANGYLRFNQTMHQGDLPTQIGSLYPDGEISYAKYGHTAELTNVYVKGYAENQVANYTNVYPGDAILDDTSIYRLILDGARR